MNTQEVIELLKAHKTQLATEVVQAFGAGREFGDARFEAWKRRLSKFLDDNLPGESNRLKAALTLSSWGCNYGDSAAHIFWTNEGVRAAAYIELLILDIKNGEYEPPKPPEIISVPDKARANKEQRGHSTFSTIEECRETN